MIKKIDKNSKVIQLNKWQENVDCEKSESNFYFIL